jgi:predicted histidine transporter YuiF (NhaC family)
VKSKAEILKIVKRMEDDWTVVACVIGFGVLGAGIGFPVAFIGFEMGVLGGGFGAFAEIFVSMLVFGILGAALGGYVGYRITRSKDK